MMKAVEVVISRKNEIVAMEDEELALQYSRVVALERMIKEMKKMLREEIIQRYGVPAEHVVGDYKIIVSERKSKVLDAQKTKEFLKAIGKLEEFTKERKSIYVEVR